MGTCKSRGWTSGKMKKINFTGTLILENCEKILFCCLSQPAGSILLQQPCSTNTHCIPQMTKKKSTIKFTEKTRGIMITLGAATREGKYVNVHYSVCGAYLCCQMCHKATASICLLVSWQLKSRAMNSNSSGSFVSWAACHVCHLTKVKLWTHAFPWRKMKTNCHFIVVHVWGESVFIYNPQGAFWKCESFENGREGWKLKSGGWERFSRVEFQLTSNRKRDCRSPHKRPQRQLEKPRLTPTVHQYQHKWYRIYHTLTWKSKDFLWPNIHDVKLAIKGK